MKIKNPSEVAIINRVVLETASRKSPRKIAFDLTRDGVPSPSGGAWTFQTIIKILQNTLYVGRVCEEQGLQDQKSQYRQAGATPCAGR